MSFICSSDFGQARDPSAIVVGEDRETSNYETKIIRGVEHRRKIHRLDLVHAERLPLHTEYPKVIARIGEISDECKAQSSEEPDNVIDLTGVGRPVYEMMRGTRRGDGSPMFRKIWPVLITAGHAATFDKAVGEWHVPKRVLVSSVAIALQEDVLKFGRDVPNVDELIDELEVFKMKITKAGNETFEAWRDGDKDDLTLATAQMVWFWRLTAPKWEVSERGAEQKIKQAQLDRVKKKNEERARRHERRYA